MPTYRRSNAAILALAIATATSSCANNGRHEHSTPPPTGDTDRTPEAPEAPSEPTKSDTPNATHASEATANPAPAPDETTTTEEPPAEDGTEQEATAAGDDEETLEQADTRETSGSEADQPEEPGDPTQTAAAEPVHGTADTEPTWIIPPAVKVKPHLDTSTLEALTGRNCQREPESWPAIIAPATTPDGKILLDISCLLHMRSQDLRDCPCVVETRPLDEGACWPISSPVGELTENMDDYSDKILHHTRGEDAALGLPELCVDRKTHDRWRTLSAQRAETMGADPRSRIWMIALVDGRIQAHRDQQDEAQ